MKTSFNKTNEQTVRETVYEATMENFLYNFTVRKVNDTVEYINCNVANENGYIGSANSSNNQINMNFANGHEVAPHVLVFQEFMNWIEENTTE